MKRSIGALLALLLASAALPAAAQQADDAFDRAGEALAKLLNRDDAGQDIYLAPFEDQSFQLACRPLSRSLRNRLVGALADVRNEWGLDFEVIGRQEADAFVLKGVWRRDEDMARITFLVGESGAERERYVDVERERVEPGESPFAFAYLPASLVEDLPRGDDDPWPVGHVFRDCDDCPEMVVLPAGGYRQGSPKGEKGRFDNEGPPRDVVIDDRFAVGRFEVTFAEWDACVAAGGCSHRPVDEWGRGRQPVMRVSWHDAREYVAWLNGRVDGAPYRLLSEAEWEYAARGSSRPTSTRFYWGDDLDHRAMCAFANGADQTAKEQQPNWTVSACADGHYGAAPVGSFRPNGFGLFDMSGNLWEWLEDCYAGSYGPQPSDGRAYSTNDCEKMVLRGGSWFIEPRSLRSAYRDWGVPTSRDLDAGFRLARTLFTS